MGSEVFARRDFESLVELDWNDADAVYARTQPLARQFADSKARLVDAIAVAGESPDLAKRCESNFFNHRVVLYHDQLEGFSLRLHFLERKKADGPHDHRATFSSLILQGGYRHELFQPPEQALRASYAGAEPQFSEEQLRALSPFLVRQEVPGSFYTLHTSAFHATMTDGDHISLVLRGPSSKPRLLYINEDRRSAEWKYGGAYESPEVLEQKRMTRDVLGELMRRVARL